MFRKFLFAILILLTIMILILLGLYFLPPKEEPIQYEYSDLEKNPLLNSKIGWYTSEEGKNYQLTWGARKGLQLNLFDFERDKLKQLRLTHIKENEFDTDGNLETTEINFDVIEVDSTLTLNVKTSKTELRATKRSSLFYEQEEIEYFNGDTRLAGLLLTPYENSKSTAIVFIHGSGISDRDNFWYLHQAFYLASKGFIVILPDKRGCGKSTGEWHTASFKDFADDISAALDYLKVNKQSEFTKLGVLGISQGGWISHLVNENRTDLDFVIDVVGSSTSPNEQVKFEIRNEILDSGAPGFAASALSGVFAKRAKARRKIWWNKNGDYDPIPLMSTTTTPILKIFGENDKNVPVSKSLELISQLLHDQPDLPIKVKVFEDSGHGLFTNETRWIRKDYLEFLDTWISSL